MPYPKLTSALALPLGPKVDALRRVKKALAAAFEVEGASLPPTLALEARRLATVGTSDPSSWSRTRAELRALASALDALARGAVTTPFSSPPSPAAALSAVAAAPSPPPLPHPVDPAPNAHLIHFRCPNCERMHYISVDLRGALARLLSGVRAVEEGLEEALQEALLALASDSKETPDVG